MIIYLILYSIFFYSLIFGQIMVLMNRAKKPLVAIGILYVLILGYVPIALYVIKNV
ncbi:hypothetical protein UT300003_32360 [Clostridium sardiniense]